MLWYVWCVLEKAKWGSMIIALTMWFHLPPLTNPIWFNLNHTLFCGLWPLQKTLLLPLLDYWLLTEIFCSYGWLLWLWTSEENVGVAEVMLLKRFYTSRQSCSFVAWWLYWHFASHWSVASVFGEPLYTQTIWKFFSHVRLVGIGI